MRSSPWDFNLHLSDCLGQGGFGQVWSVCFKRCDRLHDGQGCMAMKNIKRGPKYTKSRFQKSLLREKACLTEFSGSAFIQMYGYSGGDDSDEAYFLMEQAEGGDASQAGSLFSLVDGHLVRGGSTLHRRDVALLLHDVVDGLQRLHSRGVVHRDVKSMNLFLTNECGGRPQCRGKLSDFGLACGMEDVIGPALDNALQKCTDIVGGGTRSWWSPEHGSDSSPSTKLDIWGAGLILYQLVFGLWPGAYVRTKGKSALARSIRHFRIERDKNVRLLGRRAKSLGPLLGSYYTLLRDILESMLDPDPDVRPDSESLLDSALKLCSLCGANPHRNHRPGGQAMVDCVEESSPGTSISSSGTGEDRLVN